MEVKMQNKPEEQQHRENGNKSNTTSTQMHPYSHLKISLKEKWYMHLKKRGITVEIKLQKTDLSEKKRSI